MAQHSTSPPAFAASLNSSEKSLPAYDTKGDVKPDLASGELDSASASLAGEETYAFDDSRKLGITSSVFLILNKMIGTGSVYPPSPYPYPHHN